MVHRQRLLGEKHGILGRYPACRVAGVQEWDVILEAAGCAAQERDQAHLLIKVVEKLAVLEFVVIFVITEAGFGQARADTVLGLVKLLFGIEFVGV